MILVDSSVWIDYFNGNTTIVSEKLDSLLGFRPICTGDLILIEVLQSFKTLLGCILLQEPPNNLNQLS